MIPVIRIMSVGVFVAFDVMVTDLLNGPILLESYLTLIVPVSPGAIGPLGQLGIVQPHDSLQLEIINGAVPVFVNENSVIAFPFFSTFPKSWIGLAMVISGWLIGWEYPPRKKMRIKPNVDVNCFIVL